MASAIQVKAYLAHWFQLGKKLVWLNGKEELLPQSVIAGENFSKEFEACWQKIMSVEGKNCYLEGSNETICDLLDSTWNMDNCARCNMPVPTLELGIKSLDCVCSDLTNWPNLELPLPRTPINNLASLSNIKNRLDSKQ